ncbi:16881_t:CDS:2 [Cetraspora pellucida]|uniref:16881_t:CDS:1 n=1 Tax=Cetraspora pellucida TaxID=1433469 RepID=A0A9N8WL76_9GLOM|nr:16881_t:CDS:2 [Cetraspora pellucida]
MLIKEESPEITTVNEKSEATATNESFEITFTNKKYKICLGTISKKDELIKDFDLFLAANFANTINEKDKFK